MLLDVLQIICEDINDSWEGLAKCIGVPSDSIEKIDMESESSATKMKKCFDERNNNITWMNLKTELQKINRLDILNRIKNETLLTIGECLCSV